MELRILVLRSKPDSTQPAPLTDIGRSDGCGSSGTQPEPPEQLSNSATGRTTAGVTQPPAHAAVAGFPPGLPVVVTNDVTALAREQLWFGAAVVGIQHVLGAA